MPTVTTASTKRDLEAAQLEKASQNLAASIREADGVLPGEVDSINDTLRKYRANVWESSPSAHVQQKDTQEDTTSQQQLPSPISSSSSASGSQQAVDANAKTEQDFGPANKLLKGRDNEMAAGLIKNLPASRKRK